MSQFSCSQDHQTRFSNHSTRWPLEEGGSVIVWSVKMRKKVESWEQDCLEKLLLILFGDLMIVLWQHLMRWWCNRLAYSQQIIFHSSFLFNMKKIILKRFVCQLYIRCFFTTISLLLSGCGDDLSDKEVCGGNGK